MNNILLRMLSGFGLLILLGPLAILITWLWMGLFLPEPLPLLFSVLIMVVALACVVAWIFRGDTD